MQITLMPTIRPSHARFLSWLALAVVLHAALLLAPVAEYGRKARTISVLELSLQHPPTTLSEPEPAVAPEAPPAARPEPPPKPQSKPPEAALRPPAEPPPARTRQDTPPARPPDLSAVRLLELARRSQLATPRPGREPRLGVFTPRPPPRNWQSGSLPGEARFEGRTLPDGVEVVDRWLAADGSHHVLVATPSGEMLCGRAEAWDPSQPLVEKIMMFRSCGAGTPTFEWPEHYQRSPPAPAGGTR